MSIEGPPIHMPSDFDGTKFFTGEVPPEGVDVNGAYALAVKEIFGEAAAEHFTENGGHRHRTPLEIVQDYCKPDADRDTLELFGSGLTTEKQSVLIDQVGMELPDGEEWPRPMPGFANLWLDIYAARDEGLAIVTSDISAGHTDFIKKVYEWHRLPLPDVLITEEVLRNLKINLPLELQAKPAPLPMRLAQVAAHEILGTHFPTADINALRTIYAGDALDKDGGLARNTGVDFIFIDPTQPAEGWKQMRTALGLGDVTLGQTVGHVA
jgi:hypothetical protein